MKPIVVDDVELAQALGMSVDWVRKDRRTNRLIPFFRIGDRIKYDIDRVREALDQYEQGGPQAQRAPRSRSKAGTGA